MRILGGPRVIVGIQNEILKIHSLGLLKRLLEDKTTKTNIIWATDAYTDKGTRFERNQKIKVELITGEHSGVIKNRARKELEHQAVRTKQHAEVFTPLWICKQMNDLTDDGWFERQDNIETAHIFVKKRKWEDYVDSRKLEITCGEAPYLVSRYDVSSGESITVSERIGILDRKLRVVNENTDNEKDWMKWVIRAYQSTYGYEFQGDNLLIARVNLLMTFEEYLEDRWKRKPTIKEYQNIANIITWNIWQMDGLSCTIPYCKAEEEAYQYTLFDFLNEGQSDAKEKEQPLCRVCNWRSGKSFAFKEIGERRKNTMKFDFIIGNPPYQGEENANGRPNPIYNQFMEASYQIADAVELITPARFLFNAGLTPKAWNEKMLNDVHFKVLDYFENATEVFPNTEIKGGVAISYRDQNKQFEPIKVFTTHPELNGIGAKVCSQPEFVGLNTVVSMRGMYRLEEVFFNDAPYAKDRLGKGTGNMMVSNILEKIPEMFSEQPSNSDDLIVNGRVKNERVTLYIKRDYVIKNDFIDTYNIMIPKSNGSGRFGENLTRPVILKPGEIATDTFMSIGMFKTQQEAEFMIKYYCSKFFRTLLGINKVTQDNPQSVWRMIPLLDFLAGDIDWSKSVHEIDLQLYTKYGLTDKEIQFIESKVKEME